MQRLVNDEMVPLWVDIRHDEIPRIPVLKSVDRLLMVSGTRRAVNAAALGFYIRSYVLTPNAEVLLNEEDGAARRVLPEWQPYLKMLKSSLERFKKR